MLEIRAQKRGQGTCLEAGNALNGRCILRDKGKTSKIREKKQPWGPLFSFFEGGQKFLVALSLAQAADDQFGRLVAERIDHPPEGEDLLQSGLVEQKLLVARAAFNNFYLLVNAKS